MKKTMKISALVFACAVVYLWATCPTVDYVDYRLWLGREVSGRREAMASESARVLYEMGAHMRDPLYIYHHYGLCVIVEDEGHPSMIFLGRLRYYEF